MVVDRRRMEAVGGWRKRRIRPARGSEKKWKRETKRGNQFFGRYSNRGRTISFPRGNATPQINIPVAPAPFIAMRD